MNYRFAGIVCAFSAALVSGLNAGTYYMDPNDLDVRVGSGWRQDNLRWSFSSQQEYPNARVKFKWTELHSAQASGWINYTACDRWYLRAYGDYGRILAGNNNHVERQSENGSIYSKTSGRDNLGDVYDVGAAAGYRLLSDGGRFWFAPLFGYSYHVQRLRIEDAEQTVNTINDVTGHIPDLKVRYKSEWSTPFVGMDFGTRLECNVQLYGGGEWHWNRYRGTGNWNFDDEYENHFHHKARGNGAIARFGFDYLYCENLSFGLLGNYQHWYTHKGKYNANVPVNMGGTFGTIPADTSGHLHHVRWNSFSITLNFGMHY